MVSTGGSGPLGSWTVRSIVGNMFPLLIVLSIIVLAAGITLEDAEEMLSEYALLAVMVPTMVDMGGNLGAILSSRLSTRLHLGTARIDLRDRELWANVLAVLALAITIFTALAVGAWLLGQLLGIAMALSTLLLISLTSGLSVAVIAIVFSFAATYASYRMGIDPDDTTIPIVTNVVDVFGMVIFIGVSALVLGF
ncbi:magnesium transporter [Natronorubrum sulfidifaciens]|uniref:MgtE integral membrane region n=1 Tax=Natronorubrum sulfidifaciens JCM 14089 TaxID=1230460 RepID=L9WAX4_9EURY|nr:magnesium transporter [Natronorubrum sulfidifaciens]ELY46609.1 MgtE integral membrane region [Natronorubrum sulfidifaciens JCM 14089]